ncbi:MAG: hypothetical protein GEU75_15240 [Dehalococcoidia bacterium]|nr:hypothetical protein [Dehalococcoidia bacterium]
MAESSGSISRRRFVSAMAVGAGAAVASRLVPGRERRVEARDDSDGDAHLAWVWQFSEDGPADLTRDVLASHDLGIILKTHDGNRWMSRWDSKPEAVSGPHQVHVLAEFYETAGVPFHAWCVVQGRDPITEARMCAEVLSAGARSIVLDLEPAEKGQYWQGTGKSALQFGQELRRLQPNARIAVAPDPRPWQLAILPMGEFALFSDEVAPQTYWPLFDTRANHRLLRDWGFHVGDEGVTPELVLDVSREALAEFALPIKPIGLGTAEPPSMQRFVSHAFELGMDAISVWRYGVSNPEMWPLLREMKPRSTVIAAFTQGHGLPETIVAPEAPAVETVVEETPEMAQTAAVQAPVEVVEAEIVETLPALSIVEESATGVVAGAIGGAMAVVGVGLVGLKGWRGEASGGEVRKAA